MRLVYPSKKYYKSYEEAFNEYESNNVTTYFFDNIHTEDVEKKYYNYRKGINLKPDRVAQTTYWLVDGEKFIGEISIRHELNEALKQRGGHIGYGIRFSEWNKGYGTKMLAMALKKAKKMGLDKVMITCNDNNIGSAMVIEKNGGILQDVIDYEVDGVNKPTRRYWIKL